MKLDLKRAEVLLDAFGSQRVLVAGDLMLDRFVYGSVTRISPEAPVPVVRVTHEKNMPGGSGNVAANIQALGGMVAVAGVIGADAAGDELLRTFEAAGIGCEGVVRCAAAQTAVKTRVVAERQQVVRVDRENRFELSGPEQADFLDRVRSAAARSAAVIIEDYGKGSVTQGVADAAREAALAAGVPVGYDPKDDHPLRMDRLTLASPNRKEAFAVAGVPETEPRENPLEDESLLAVARTLQERWQARMLLVTLGAQGILLVEQGSAPRHIPARVREVFDVSGAGDTVIAVCMLALAAGATAEEAAELANFAAGVVVGKLGTATCTCVELLEYMKRYAGLKYG